MPSTRNSSRLLIIAFILIFATSLVFSLSYTNNTGVELDFEASQQTISSLDDGFVSNITLSIEFLKTDGTCLEPLPGFAFHREIVLRLISPAGTSVTLVDEGTYGGGNYTDILVVTFDDSADTAVGGVPSNGSFKPVEPLSAFDGELAGGTWTLYMEDKIALDPLCVYEWTINIESTVINTAPIADDFTIEIMEDEIASFNFFDYVTDNDDDILTVETQTTPSNGVLNLADDGSAIFTPEEEWAGIVTIDYLANDSELDSNIATATIIILPVNDAPNCDALNLSPSTIFPPNHREVSLDISGITDVDSTIITTEFTEITSNQAINGTGDGNTDPDWSLEDGWVRAERSGNDGDRIYSISFSADDEDWTGTFVDPDNLLEPDPVPTDEGACDGTGIVIVPHDQRNNLNQIDNGSNPSINHANANSNGNNNSRATHNSGNGNNDANNNSNTVTTQTSNNNPETTIDSDGDDSEDNTETSSEANDVSGDTEKDINGCNGNGHCYGHGNANGNANGNSNGNGRGN